MNHLSNEHTNAKFSVTGKWDEAGTDMAHVGKNQSLTQLITLNGKTSR